jgi:hypothetical protein
VWYVSVSNDISWGREAEAVTRPSERPTPRQAIPTTIRVCHAHNHETTSLLTLLAWRLDRLRGTRPLGISAAISNRLKSRYGAIRVIASMYFRVSCSGPRWHHHGAAELDPRPLRSSDHAASKSVCCCRPGCEHAGKALALAMTSTGRAATPSRQRAVRVRWLSVGTKPGWFCRSSRLG